MAAAAARPRAASDAAAAEDEEHDPETAAMPAPPARPHAHRRSGTLPSPRRSHQPLPAPIRHAASHAPHVLPAACGHHPLSWLPPSDLRINTAAYAPREPPIPRLSVTPVAMWDHREAGATPVAMSPLPSAASLGATAAATGAATPVSTVAAFANLATAASPATPVPGTGRRPSAASPSARSPIVLLSTGSPVGNAPQRRAADTFAQPMPKTHEDALVPSSTTSSPSGGLQQVC
ncbi:hypothetical protein HK105_207506 [Polyrhizophydium stewartii]|uniref:Uncharacterized protein n=1 Tax=Polyrhizophydium stewartii TaxID=2732419 RepID=A0ABR4N0S7_9FUNG